MTDQPQQELQIEGVYMDRSIRDFQRSCCVHIAEEQSKASPDSALIALLCDAVRCSRELARVAEGKEEIAPTRAALASAEAEIQRLTQERETPEGARVFLHTCKTDRDDGECMACSQIDCPDGEPLHYHHDGCPCCSQRPASVECKCGGIQFGDGYAHAVDCPARSEKLEAENTRLTDRSDGLLDALAYAWERGNELSAVWLEERAENHRNVLRADAAEAENTALRDEVKLRERERDDAKERIHVLKDRAETHEEAGRQYRYVCRFTLEEIEAMAETGVVPETVRTWFRHGAQVLRGERTDFLPRT